MLTDPLLKAYHQSKWALVIRGLMGIVLGLFIFMRPLTSVAAFALVIAIWALSDGIVSIVNAFHLRSVIDHWGILLLSGIVSLLFGIAALYYYPALSLAFAVMWTAWWLIAGGSLGVYIAMQERKADLPWGWTLVSGLIAIAFGVLAIVYPAITLAALMGVIGAFGLVGGVAMLVGAGKMQSFESDARNAVSSPSRA